MAARFRVRLIGSKQTFVCVPFVAAPRNSRRDGWCGFLSFRAARNTAAEPGSPAAVHSPTTGKGTRSYRRPKPPKLVNWRAPSRRRYYLRSGPRRFQWATRATTRSRATEPDPSASRGDRPQREPWSNLYGEMSVSAESRGVAALSGETMPAVDRGAYGRVRQPSTTTTLPDGFATIQPRCETLASGSSCNHRHRQPYRRIWMIQPGL
jgi:hypothetical protein